jgi:hypothetical protein
VCEVSSIVLWKELLENIVCSNRDFKRFPTCEVHCVNDRDLVDLVVIWHLTVVILSVRQWLCEYQQVTYPFVHLSFFLSFRTLQFMMTFLNHCEKNKVKHSWLLSLNKSLQYTNLILFFFIDYWNLKFNHLYNIDCIENIILMHEYIWILTCYMSTFYT